MSPMPQTPRCPHCNSLLRAFDLPDELAFESKIHFCCFNNDCSYYRDGWAWMSEKYAVSASYRYRLDPANDIASPILVWSDEALVDRIVDLEPEIRSQG